jgi:hypothetical protein
MHVIKVDIKLLRPTVLVNSIKENKVEPKREWQSIIDLFLKTTLDKMLGVKGYSKCYLFFENDIAAVHFILKYS